MRINAISFSLATAVTTAIMWVICSLFVWTMPGPMMTTTGHMVHMDVSRFGLMLSPMGVIWGLVVWSVVAGLFGWVLATLYNLFNRGPKE